MPTSQLPANGQQFPITPPATDLVSNGSKVDTRNNETPKSNPPFSANKRKREPVGGGDINDNEKKKLDGEDNNVESSGEGIKEVEMKDAEIDGSGGIKEVEMQDATTTEVQEKTIREEDHEGKVNNNDHIRSNPNITEVCKQNQTTNKLSECNEKQIEGVIRDDEEKVNKDDYVRSNLNETDGCKLNETPDRSECNEKEINGQRALGEVTKLLKQVQETSDEKAKLEVDIKVIKKTDYNEDKKENGNDNDQKVARVSCP